MLVDKKLATVKSSASNKKVLEAWKGSKRGGGGKTFLYPKISQSHLEPILSCVLMSN